MSETLEVTYRPSEDEPFMSDRQRDYFRKKLLVWKEEILKEAKETLVHLQNESENHPDVADRASSETDRTIELRSRDRQRKLISKIDAALLRIVDRGAGTP
jgi:DnaK suppressor protein